MPRIRLIAGPNGAGKTSLMKTLVSQKVPIGQYINPDDIARHIVLPDALQRTETALNTHPGWPEPNEEFDNYFSVSLAQTIATGLRQDWLHYQLSLTYESVMSHESHLDFIDSAIAAGFEPYLYYICTSDPEIHKARVKQRVASNGHDVPEDKIVSRYYRSLKLLEKMTRKCKRAYFFDNSGHHQQHFAEITPDGYLDIFEAQFNQADPIWFVDNLLKAWPKSKIRLATL
ncbi:zeta toxin family protein [Halopseudomonas salegens]|uniref:Predicted ABC-type ATPase n=1 Tax=Halopseudomonas salegens TaxID=1434072 RepID=A0A1H2FL99_9GAMM|nr:zeta toxin family protein [Halopseudomonas salegens]SDU08133.1 Predicted ABC-type ATPase [Halopseudomonas salegens]